MDREALATHLATLGLTESSAIAYDATITPDTLIGPLPSARPPANQPAPPLGARVGPLPRIGLSGLVEARAPRPAGGGVPRPSMDEAADLEVVALLGEGGMGRVHLARQRSLGRDVAIKTLKAEVADGQAVAMLREEATTMGRLEHPNVVPVHAVGRDDDGRLLLVMKRVDGVAWSDLLHDPEHPRWAALAPRAEERLELHLDVLGQVANALHFAHARGTIHRDVKPENVLLGEHGEVYLADWGIALRLDAPPSTSLVGTPAYMAPEMVVADSTRIDARTDVFLLGATLHEVLTGEPPHKGPTVYAVLMSAHLAAPPVYDASVPSELAAIATRAMSPRPEDRFPSALEFRRALDLRRRHAGALALVRSARTLLVEIEASMAVSDGRETETDRRLTECRFAFVQALREWPENSDARAGLDAALRLAVRNELARENPVAARSLLAELSVADDALGAETAALEARLAARRGDAERLRKLAADEDLRVGLRSRVAVGSIVGIMAVVIMLYFSFGPRADAGLPVVQELVGIASMLAFVVTLAVVLLRKHLMANAAGRRTVALLVGGMLSLVLHRVIGAAQGVSTTGILSMDMVHIALFTGSAGLIVPRAAWAALVLVGGAVVSAFYPASVVTIFSVTCIIAIAALAALWMSAVEARGDSTEG